MLNTTQPTQGNTAATDDHAAHRPVTLLDLPELAVAAMAGWSVPSMLLILGNAFTPLWAVLLGVLGAAAAVALAGFPSGPLTRRVRRTRRDGIPVPRGEVAAEPANRPDADPADGSPVPLAERDGLWTAVAGAGVLGFTVFNVTRTSQNIYQLRDPNAYGAAGRWLADHASLNIPTNLELFGTDPGINFVSAGIGFRDIRSLYAQGNHLLPAFLAPVAHYLGESAMFRFSALLGGLALLAFFGLVRRVAGGLLALVATTALATSLPFLYVSRDTFSETATLLFLTGGLSLLVWAFDHPTTGRYVAAGLALGAAAMARIDSTVALVSVPVVFGLVLLRAGTPVERRTALRHAGALLGTVLVLDVIGFLDILRVSAGYYNDHRSEILASHAALAAALGVMVLAVVLDWSTGTLTRLWRERRRLLGLAGAGLVVVVLVALGSRPLWMTQHGHPDDGYIKYVEAIQKGTGLAVDGTRTYNELTVSWEAWYYGWPTLVLALLGYALLAFRLLARGQGRLLAPLIMGLSLSLLYFYDARITPDQVWAMRRFVPVVIPIMLMAAVVALGWLWARHRWLRPVAALGAVLVIVVPAVITFPMQALRADVPQLALVESLCRTVPADGGVIATDEAASESLLQVVRSYCNVPAAGLVKPTRAQLAAVRTAMAAGGRTLYAIAQDPATLGMATPAADPTLQMHGERLPALLEAVPQDDNEYDIAIWVGLVSSDGSVTALPSTP